MIDNFEETVGFGDECWEVVVTNGGDQIKIRTHERGAVLSVPMIMSVEAAVWVYEALGRAIRSTRGK